MLSSEDQLRLNVLVTQPLHAIRIDESQMCVHALSDRGEAKVRLNPTCGNEKYVKHIRQFLSTHYLGSPGGYPVFMSRWTRMGQARDNSLEKLLLIGEPEAVAAVVHAPGLTDELARRAWWSIQSAENARRMLEKQSVVEGSMGSILAEFLLEFLPFEEQQKAIVDSVRLILQSDLVTPEVRHDLWKRAKRKNSYYVGFLRQTPDDLPGKSKAHARYEEISEKLKGEIQNENETAKLLRKVFSPHGQAYLHTAALALNKPSDQDVVVMLLNTIGDYFSKLNPPSRTWRDMTALIDSASESIYQNEEAGRILSIDPSLTPQVKALHCLAMSSETLVDPIFGTTDAIGTVMRKKIQSVVEPIEKNILALSRGS